MMKGYKVALVFASVAVTLASFCHGSINETSHRSHHRVRRFIFTKNSQVSFDLELMIPIPMLGSVAAKAIFEIPLTVTMQNDTFTWNPINIPYVVMPAPEPIPIPFPPMLPSHYPQQSNYYPNIPVNYNQANYNQPPSPMMDPYATNMPVSQYAAASRHVPQFVPSQQAPPFEASDQPPQQQQQHVAQPYQRSFVDSHSFSQHVPEPNQSHFGDQNLFHHRMKRDVAAAAAQHRFDLFTTIATSLDEFGLDGKACILQSVCQLAQAPLLIESPLHEVLEHVLLVSRGNDEEEVLTEYEDAEKFGRSQGDCRKKFSSCGFSFFELHNLL